MTTENLARLATALGWKVEDNGSCWDITTPEQASFPGLFYRERKECPSLDIVFAIQAALTEGQQRAYGQAIRDEAQLTQLADTRERPLTLTTQDYDNEFLYIVACLPASVRLACLLRVVGETT